MKQILIKLFLLIILLTTMACGFKVVDKTQLNNFKISEIKSTGDKRINYKIKNYLLINSLETSQNIISLNINVNKAKEIKEKNLKNEVTKYEININVSVKIDFENQRDNHSITISRKGDFLVGTSYVATLNNEKKLTENLTENIFKIILKEIVYQTNDL